MAYPTPLPPANAPADLRLNPDGGVMFVGERGLLLHDTYGTNPRLVPDTLGTEVATIPQTLRRIEGGIGGHEQNWIRAIRGEEEISCPFSYASHLNEIMLLGIAALHAEQPLRYDGGAMRFPDAPDADQYLRRMYWSGWELPVIG